MDFYVKVLEGLCGLSFKPLSLIDKGSEDLAANIVREIVPGILVVGDRIVVQEAGISASMDGCDEERVNLVLELLTRCQKQSTTPDIFERIRAANMSKNRFIANISHEIRTPLNGIVGMVSMLKDTGLDNDQRSFVRTIEKSSETLQTIIEDILDFSRLEAGRVRFENTDFNLRGIVDEVKELLAIQAQKKGLDIRLKIAESVPPFFRTDPQRLKQILTNLVSNAIKFTDNGYIEISVEEHSRGNLLFSVKDTGIGIPTGQWEDIFEAFNQLQNGSKVCGTGLGLAITKKLIEAQGGSIKCESKPQEGSLFTFFLPEKERDHKRRIPAILLISGDSGFMNILDEYKVSVDRVERADTISPKYDYLIIDGRNIPCNLDKIAASRGRRPYFIYRGEEESSMGIPTVKDVESLPRLLGLQKRIGKSVPKDQREKYRLLLVEDNEINRSVAVYIIEKLGYRLDVCENGKQAIEILSRSEYDLVLMDIQMPVMDGTMATRIIRDINSDVLRHDVPIVAMTAHAMKDDRKRFIDMGMDDYIPKPVSPDNIDNVISSILLGNDKTQLQEKEETKVTFDREELLRRTMGNHQIMEKVLSLFRERLPEYVDDIITSITAGDYNGARIHSHTLKGAAANISAGRLFTITREICLTEGEIRTQFINCLKRAKKEFLDTTKKKGIE